MLQFRKLSICLMVIFACPVLAQEQFTQTEAPESALASFTTFEIRSFDVQGNTLLPQAKIDQTLTSFLGKSQHFEDIQLALASLQKAYNDAGYGAIQVTIPEQRLAQGVVRFDVIEGKLGEVLLEGNALHDDKNIRAGLPKLVEGTAPKADEIAANVKVVNENPSKQLVVLLKPSSTVGVVDAVVQTTESNPIRWGFLLDNTGNDETGNLRIGAYYQHANLWNLDHVLTLQATTTPDGGASRVKIFGAGYHIPIYAWKGSLDLFAGYSDVNSGIVQNLFSVSGAGNVYGIHYNQNLNRIGNYDHKVTLGLDSRHYRNNVELVGSGISLLPDVSVTPISLTYSGQKLWIDKKFSFNVSAIHNIPGGSTGKESDFKALRAEADSHFTIFRYGVEFVNQFKSDWQGRLALNGQLTNDALVPGEQFGLGGSESVRGFFERELGNDEGQRLSAELYTPDWGSKLNGNTKARALAFVDVGRVTRNHELIGETNSESIASVGVGLRMKVAERLSIRADVGSVLDAGASGEKGDVRGHVALGLTF